MIRIGQCHIGSCVKFFGVRFLEKWKLKEYRYNNSPAVFFGMYNNDLEILKNHKSAAVIVWTGSDSIDISAIKSIRKDNIIHISGSKYISNDLAAAGIKNFKFIPVSVLDQNELKIKPIPLGNKIYVYPDQKQRYGTDKHNDFYGYEITEKLFEIFGKERFICAGSDTYKHEELYKNIYPQCFIGLRLVPHDGLSETVVELGLHGRKIIYNGNEPNSINYSNFDDIVSAIKSEEKNIGKTHYDIAGKMNNYIDIGDKWLYI